MSGASEILMFQVGPRVFAAEVYDVVRLGSVRGVPDEALLTTSALGEPFERRRGIVVASQDGVERFLFLQLKIYSAFCIHVRIVELHDQVTPFLLDKTGQSRTRMRPGSETRKYPSPGRTAYKTAVRSHVSLSYGIFMYARYPGGTGCHVNTSRASP